MWYSTPNGTCNLSMALGILIAPGKASAGGFDVIAQFEVRQWILASLPTTAEAASLLANLQAELQRRTGG